MCVELAAEHGLKTRIPSCSTPSRPSESVSAHGDWSARQSAASPTVRNLADPAGGSPVLGPNADRCARGRSWAWVLRSRRGSPAKNLFSVPGALWPEGRSRLDFASVERNRRTAASDDDGCPPQARLRSPKLGVPPSRGLATRVIGRRRRFSTRSSRSTGYYSWRKRSQGMRADVACRASWWTKSRHS